MAMLGERVHDTPRSSMMHLQLQGASKLGLPRGHVPKLEPDYCSTGPCGDPYAEQPTGSDSQRDEQERSSFGEEAAVPTSQLTQAPAVSPLGKRKSKSRSSPQRGACSPPGSMTSTGGARNDSSLGALTKKFLDLMRREPSRLLDLNSAAALLKVQKRRIYDITNVLEGIGLLQKQGKNSIQWLGDGAAGPEGEGTAAGGAAGSGADSEAGLLREDIAQLQAQEQQLDDHIAVLSEALKAMSSAEANRPLLYVTDEDVVGLPGFEADTLFAVKAPPSTLLEVPDPDQDPHLQLQQPGSMLMGLGRRRYRVKLQSNAGPVDVFLLQHSNKHTLQDAPSSQAPAGTGAGQPAQLQQGPLAANDAAMLSEAASMPMGPGPTCDATGAGPMQAAPPSPRATSCSHGMPAVQGEADAAGAMETAAAGAGLGAAAAEAAGAGGDQPMLHLPVQYADLQQQQQQQPQGVAPVPEGAVPGAWMSPPELHALGASPLPGLPHPASATAVAAVAASYACGLGGLSPFGTLGLGMLSPGGMLEGPPSLGLGSGAMPGSMPGCDVAEELMLEAWWGPEPVGWPAASSVEQYYRDDRHSLLDGWS